MSDRITVSQEIDLIKMEYERLTAEIRLYTEQYSPKFSAFGIFVLSAFSFAFTNNKYDVVYAIIPLFIFVIFYVTIAQSHIMTVLSGRVKNVEKRIKHLNGGKPILEWEHRIVNKFILPPIITYKLAKNEDITRHIPNPIFCSVIVIIIAVLPLFGYSLYRAYGFFQRELSPWAGIAFIIFCIAIFIGMIIQGLSFFFIGKEIEEAIID